MNPLLTSAVLSTGQQVINHYLSAAKENTQDEDAFSKVLNQKIKDSFDVARYLHDNGLQTPHDVAEHIQELKARLLENRDLSDTGLLHSNPSATAILRKAEGYTLKNGDLEVPLEAGSQTHELAKAIHHLETWLRND